MQLFSLFDDLSTDKFSLENLEKAILKFLTSIGLASSEISGYISHGLDNILSKSSSLFAALLSNSSSMLFTISVGMVFSYFFSAYYSGLRESFIKIFDPKKREKIHKICDQIPGVIRNYLKGLSGVMIILSIVNTIIYLVIGLDYALIWGIMSGLLALIPYLGSAIAVLLPMSYSFIASDGMTQPLIIFGAFIVVQQIEGNLLTPKIIGDAVKVNPLFAIIFMLVSGKIWGIFGVFVSIILAGILKLVLDKWKYYDAYAELMSEKVDDKSSILEDVMFFK